MLRINYEHMFMQYLFSQIYSYMNIIEKINSIQSMKQKSEYQTESAFFLMTPTNYTVDHRNSIFNHLVKHNVALV